MSGEVRIGLIGGVTVSAPNGSDITPRSAKARALIALLARSAGMERPRRWLESKLWSDRATAQASGSLRQALSEIRRCFGDNADVMQTNRSSVRLKDCVSDIEADPVEAAHALASGRSFLEGLRTRDPAFDEWADLEATVVAREVETQGPRDEEAPRPRRGNLPIVLNLHEGAADPCGFRAMELGHAVGGALSQFAAVDIFAPSPGDTRIDLMEQGLALDVRTGQQGSITQVHMTLSEARQGKILWARNERVSEGDADLLERSRIPQLVFEAVDAALRSFDRHLPDCAATHKANVLLARAFADVFSYDAARLDRAEATLKALSRIDSTPPGLVEALRGAVRQIMFVELTQSNAQDLMEEADEFAHEAVQLGGDNGLVLALASQVRIMLDADQSAGAILAQDALARAPHNPMAHAAIASCHLRAQAYQKALDAALQSACIAVNTRFNHWFYSLCGLASLAMGQWETSTGFFERCHAHAPLFRSPMRHLIFLYMAQHRDQRAFEVLRRLTRIDPGFSTDRVMADEAYPVATLRNTNLISTYGPRLA